VLPKVCVVLLLFSLAFVCIIFAVTFRIHCYRNMSIVVVEFEKLSECAT